MKVNGQNIILKGASGTLGDQFVIRQRKGRIVIAAMPKKSPKPLSPARKKNMGKFKRAVIFAKRVRENPVLLTQHNIRVKRNQSVYHAAIAYYMGQEGL